VFARTTSITAQPSMIDQAIAHVQDTVMPALSHVDGYLGLSLILDRGTGRAIVTTAWRSQEAMRGSAERVSAIRDEAVRMFGAAGADVDTWEVSVMHRAHHMRQGSCMRVIWLGMDSGAVADAIETFKQGTLSKIEDLPGFCTASLFVNRGGGRAVTTVGYDDRAALEASRGAASALRAEASRQMTAEIIEVAEFELALAHLHVPEMV
jgi:heme-degrading monooxygenase HmoA